LLRRVHGATRHVGEVPGQGDPVAGALTPTQQIARLVAGLAAAVAAERFEEAAELRDRLRLLREQAE
jgi:protein-arginine kinase activator protein McsA